MKISLVIIVILFSTLSCNNSTDIFKTDEGISIRKDVDQAVLVLDNTIGGFNKVVRIDHSRLAEEGGVFTPPSVVTIFSNPEVNSNLIKLNPTVAIDLPFKVLCYSEPDLAEVSIAYTAGEFIETRHGLTSNDLHAYSQDIDSILSGFDNQRIANTDMSRVSLNYGLITSKSDYDFAETLSNLNKAIQEQGDTVIFGEVDFKEEANQFNISLAPTTLILFGAPEPGGKAMHDTPKIGLDAFCQKLLVFEKKNEVFIAYNDIKAFSELYYETSTLPQMVINKRLKKVFESAITND